MQYNDGMSSLSPQTDTPSEIWTESELLQKLHSSVGRAAIITSTDRGARTLRQRYNQRQYAGGHSGWRTPQILAWDPWIETLWDAGILHGLENRVALAEIQELEIW